MTRKERLKIIWQIKAYKEPPFLDSDIYYTRLPWAHIGGLGSFAMSWCWFRDEVILAKATDDELVEALKELKDTWKS